LFVTASEQCQTGVRAMIQDLEHSSTLAGAKAAPTS
jgi:hypothetical protein